MKKKERTKHIIREMTVSMNHIEVTLFTSNLLNLKAKQKDLLIISMALDFVFLHFFSFFDTLKVCMNRDCSDVQINS